MTIDFEPLRKAAAEATPGPWDTWLFEANHHRSVIQIGHDATLLALARNLFAPLLDVAEAGEFTLTTHCFNPLLMDDALARLYIALATLTEAVEREAP